MYLGLNNMNNFKTLWEKYFGQCWGCAMQFFRRKFDADRRIFKLSTIFQIWLEKSLQNGVKRANLHLLSYSPLSLLVLTLHIPSPPHPTVTTKDSSFRQAIVLSCSDLPDFLSALHPATKSLCFSTLIYNLILLYKLLDLHTMFCLSFLNFSIEICCY